MTMIADEVKNLLFKYELAEKEKQTIRAKHQAAFDKVEDLDRLQGEIKDATKRLLFTTDGPPPDVEIGHRSHVWADGDMYKIECVYKKHSDFYDPKKLPVEAFKTPGIVTEVDKSVCDKLAKKDPRVQNALVHGKWMTPAVSFPRITKEAK